MKNGAKFGWESSDDQEKWFLSNLKNLKQAANKKNNQLKHLWKNLEFHLFVF